MTQSKPTAVSVATQLEEQKAKVAAAVAEVERKKQQLAEAAAAVEESKKQLQQKRQKIRIQETDDSESEGENDGMLIDRVCCLLLNGFFSLRLSRHKFKDHSRCIFFSPAAAGEDDTVEKLERQPKIRFGAQSQFTLELSIGYGIFLKPIESLSKQDPTDEQTNQSPCSLSGLT